MVNDDEDINFWLSFTKNDLANRCAILHKQRREFEESKNSEIINAVRKVYGELYLSGEGVEVGAGSRTFPLPEGATCFYGDIRDKAELSKYFNTDEIFLSGYIDAQTLENIPVNSLDFIISAHVIEHLFDPIGSIVASINRLKKGGIFILIVPDMRFTFDCKRPPTHLQHCIDDYLDGGQGTKLIAYEEHVRYVHPYLTGNTIPENLVRSTAEKAMKREMDLHVHAWNKEEFTKLLQYVAKNITPFDIVGSHSVLNENIFILMSEKDNVLSPPTG